MVVDKMWFTEERKNGRLINRKTWRGWFLFGIIPLYIQMQKIVRYL